LGPINAAVRAGQPLKIAQPFKAGVPCALVEKSRRDESAVLSSLRDLRFLGPIKPSTKVLGYCQATPAKAAFALAIKLNRD